MTAKSMLALAILLVCGLPGRAADLLSTTGTAGSLSTSTTAVSPAAIDSFLKRHKLDLPANSSGGSAQLSGGTAGLLVHSLSSSLLGTLKQQNNELPGLLEFNALGRFPKFTTNLAKSPFVLIETLRHGDTPEARRDAAEELGRQHCTDAVDALSDAVRDADASVGDAAFHALGGISPYRAIWARWRNYIFIAAAIVAAAWIFYTKK